MSHTPVPYIPENAPFSPEQRAWLNGLLAGMFSATAVPNLPALPARASHSVAVYFASQSGTAERLAKKFAKELKSQGHQAHLACLSTIAPADLARQTHAVIFASTYGDGEAPDSVKSFRESLLAESIALNKLQYTVFALGDSSYEQFCRFGVELDERLAELGAQRIEARVESDVDVDPPFVAWKDATLARLSAIDMPSVHTNTAVTAPANPVPEAQRYTRDNPFHAEIVARHALTNDISSKLTIHLGLQLDEAVKYEAGDACGVLAENDPALVDETIAKLGFSTDAPVEVPKFGACTLQRALSHHYQHTRLTRKMVQAFAEKTQCKTLAALLPAEQGAHLDSFLWDRGLIDLVLEYPGAIESPQALLAMLPRLAPRLYSISSSPAKHGNELNCTIAVVRYRSHNRERGGVASTMLSERIAMGGRVPMYIQPNKRFRLPQDSSTPMIMIGPGTGIAPFRSFLHEREALGHTGRNWLFFGERSASTDFLYEQELTTMAASGHLTRLDTAFSRDQAHKIYVQDRMVEHGSMFWSWLAEGARVYVCGDASRMARDVDQALHSLIETHGAMSADAAKEYISQMHDDGRYHKDVY